MFFFRLDFHPLFDLPHCQWLWISQKKKSCFSSWMPLQFFSWISQPFTFFHFISDRYDVEKRFNGCGSSSGRHFDVINWNSKCDLPLKQWRHWWWWWRCWQLYSHFGDDVMSFHSVLCLRLPIYGMVWYWSGVLLDKQLSLTLNIAFLRIVRSIMWFLAQAEAVSAMRLWTLLSDEIVVKSRARVCANAT